jgi:hypothetical protein
MARALTPRSPDYRAMPRDQAEADLRQRIRNYEAAYEPVSDEEGVAFVKMINLGAKLEIFQVRGRLPSAAVWFVMHTHIAR